MPEEESKNSPVSSQTTASVPNKIGFAGGIIGAEPVRFEILAAEVGKFFAFNKPARVLADAYDGAPRAKSVVAAVKKNSEKGEFVRLGAVSPALVAAPDFEMSGAALVGSEKDCAARLRNAMWSGAFKFEYLLLCANSDAGGEDEFVKNLPMCRPPDSRRWIVSHRYGKKSLTRFAKLETRGEYSLWCAETKSPRPHQVRLHAAEGGLNIVGEGIYSRTPYIMLSKIKRGKYKKGFGEKEMPLYSNLCAHLGKISFDASLVGGTAGEKIEIAAPLPKGFSVCLKRLGFFKSSDEDSGEAPSSADSSSGTVAFSSEDTDADKNSLGGGEMEDGGDASAVGENSAEK